MTTPASPLFKRLMNFKKQLLLHNPAIKIEKSLFSYAVYDRAHYKKLCALLENPQEYLSSAASQRIKHDKTSSLFLVQLGSLHWVVKRYNFRGWRWLFKRSFRMSRARRSWINAHLLQKLALPSVKPLAFFERRLGFVRIQSYFIAEYLNGTLLSDYFNDNAGAVEKTQIADRVIALLGQLATHAIHHGDLKATNILLHQGQPRLLDLDALRFYPNHHHRKFKRTFANDVKRFMKNWRSFPEVDQLFHQRLSKLQPYLTVSSHVSTKRAYHRAKTFAQSSPPQKDSPPNHD